MCVLDGNYLAYKYTNLHVYMCVHANAHRLVWRKQPLCSLRVK